MFLTLKYSLVPQGACHALPGPQWMGGAPSSKAKGASLRPVGLSPHCQGLAALPEWVLPSFHWEGKCCCCLATVPVGKEAVEERRHEVQKWALPPSLGLRFTVSEVFFECFILGMNLTGYSSASRAKALLRTAVIWRTPAGPVPTADGELANSMHLCAFCLKFRLNILLKSFRKYNQNDM